MSLKFLLKKLTVAQPINICPVRIELEYPLLFMPEIVLFCFKFVDLIKLYWNITKHSLLR
jgi:hypothetical protein